MTHCALDELLSYTQQHAEPISRHLTDFIKAYFDKADPAELQDRSPATLFALANAHWRLLDGIRPSNTAKVRVFNPTLAEDGFASEHTVVQIVNDNMPFLVDSVTMAINRGNRTVHWIVHPLISVARDSNGKVQGISNAAAPASAHPDSVESFILVECDRIVSRAERQALAAELERVLDDVRSAVQDWRPMMERAKAVAAEASSPSLSPTGRQEGG
ncbi:MAG: NAD-glutamate dehydrogenase, partial [Rhodoferax sp.]|nr:NAD-glutamate dehydrogenase [Rhodoferax sp.]